MIANPNQPTGTQLPMPILQELAQRSAAVGALMAVDEAYVQFSGQTVLPWLEAHPHLVVLRTFSKAAGLAGLRIGFAAGHPEVIANLFRVRTAHDINSIAILAAQILLEHPQLIDDNVAAVRAGAALLADRVRELGLEPLPTCTNFMVIRVTPHSEAAVLVERLRRQGYLVKGPFRAPCLQGCIRVTLGSPPVMERFAQALRTALDAAP